MYVAIAIAIAKLSRRHELVAIKLYLRNIIDVGFSVSQGYLVVGL